MRGIDKFRESFVGREDEYVLIGGGACDLLFGEAGQDFRATKDLDLVLLVEALTPEFGRVFWDFVREGGYENRQKSSGKPQFYRFSKPKDPAFPAMLELFARTASTWATGIPALCRYTSATKFLVFLRFYWTRSTTNCSWKTEYRPAASLSCRSRG